MSSPSRRRRSHPASAALFSASSSSVQLARKIAVKRSHLHYLSSPPRDSPSAYKWDIEGYRWGRRRKRATSAGSDISRNIPCGFPQHATFAVSSRDFGLPLRNWRSRRSSINTSSSHMDVSHSQTYESMQTLRSHAFFELQKSIEENGEGLVRRMQEQEYQRSRDTGRTSPSFHASPARCPASRPPSQSDVDGDEDDEIQIYAGEPPDWPISHPPNPMSTRKDIGKDTDPPPIPGSHGASWSTELNPPTPFPSSSSYPMPVTTSYSLASPLLPSKTTDTLRFSSRHEPFGTGTDKAIEALTLQLANGAGGLNDYAPLQHDISDDAEMCDAGDLWS